MTTTLLISLDKKYFDQIKSGIKKFEYRRKFIDEPGRAYLYITAPTKKITSFIDFGVPIIDTPKKIAEVAEKQVSGIGQEIYEYMSDLDYGYVIPIKRLVTFKSVSLDYLRIKFLNFHPPQSYLYLNKKIKLLNYLKAQEKLDEWILE